MTVSEADYISAMKNKILFGNCFMIACEVVCKYNDYHSIIYLSTMFVINLLFCWYLIPALIRYVYPGYELLIELLNERLVKNLSVKLANRLPSIWQFESQDKLWLIQKLRRFIKLILFIQMISFRLRAYSYLSLSLIGDLYMTLGFILLMTKTSWNILDAFDHRLHPFILILTIENFIPSVHLLIYLLLTAMIYPLFYSLLTSQSIEEIITYFQFMNFRAYLEFDIQYKQFFAELINLLISIYIAQRICTCCSMMNLSWTYTIILISCLWIYSYTKFIYLIIIQPNLVLLTITSIVFSRMFLNLHVSNSKYLILVGFLLIYFMFLYPSIYLLVRQQIINSSTKFNSKLRSIRREIRRKCLPTFFQSSSKNLLIHSLTNFVHFILLISIVFFL